MYAPLLCKPRTRPLTAGNVPSIAVLIEWTEEV